MSRITTSCVLLSLILAGAAAAEPRGFTGTLFVEVPGSVSSFQVTGSGVAEVAPSPVGGIQIPPGAFQFDTVRADPASPYIQQITFAGSNASGSFASGGFGAMAISGIARFNLLAPVLNSTTTLPLGAIGVGGIRKAFAQVQTGPVSTSTVTLTLSGADWTVGVTTASGTTSHFGPTMIMTQGFNNRTAGGGGNIQFVTPMVIQRTEFGSFDERLPGFARLTLQIAPEPGPLAVGSVTVAALIGLGLRRRYSSNAPSPRSTKAAATQDPSGISE